MNFFFFVYSVENMKSWFSMWVIHCVTRELTHWKVFHTVNITRSECISPNGNNFRKKVSEYKIISRLEFKQQSSYFIDIKWIIFHLWWQDKHSFFFFFCSSHLLFLSSIFSWSANWTAELSCNKKKVLPDCMNDDNFND